MKYWKRVDKEGVTTTVESYSYDLEIEGAIEIDEQEFDEYIASIPPAVKEPIRDLAAEIDELKEKVKILETR